MGYKLDDSPCIIYVINVMEDHFMKKIITMTLAISLGILIGVTSSVFAAQSDYVQATFQKFKLVVNGEEKELSSDPLVYKGTTYLPVRTVFDAVGFDVKYDAGTKTISANSQTEVMKGGAALDQTVTSEVEEIEKQIKYWQDQITNDQEVIKNLEIKLEQINNDSNLLNQESKQSMIDSTNKTIQQFQKNIDQATSKIKELQSQLQK